MKLAAIDIGSNAVRLLITEVSESPDGTVTFSKLNLIRIPIRLGFDVFENGTISDEKTFMLVQTLKSFRHLINAYHVDHIKACATSAMRDAINAQKIINIVKKETGLEIEVISGEFEASLIFENGIAEHLDDENDYMYVDVGGGSTEISFYSNGSLSFKKSYNIGTIRILKKGVLEEDWNEMKQDLKFLSKTSKKIMAIGSGGNINKIFSMSKRKEGKSLSVEILREYYKELNALTVENRIILYNLREDRADVIVPALQIYLNAMRWAGAIEIFVPKIGLADGLTNHLWQEIKYSLT